MQQAADPADRVTVLAFPGEPGDRVASHDDVARLDLGMALHVLASLAAVPLSVALGGLGTPVAAFAALLVLSAVLTLVQSEARSLRVVLGDALGQLSSDLDREYASKPSHLPEITLTVVADAGSSVPPAAALVGTLAVSVAAGLATGGSWVASLLLTVAVVALHVLVLWEDRSSGSDTVTVDRAGLRRIAKGSAARG